MITDAYLDEDRIEEENLAMRKALDRIRSLKASLCYY